MYDDTPSDDFLATLKSRDFSSWHFHSWKSGEKFHEVQVSLSFTTIEHGITMLREAAALMERVHFESDQRPVYAEYIKSVQWAKRRMLALHDAGNRCQVCISEDRLNVHHNTYERLGQEHPGDLVVLCRECHAKFHDRIA